MATYTYSADEISAIFCGIILGGWADDDCIVIEHEADDFSDQAGADGLVTRVKTRDPRVNVKFRFVQAAPVNLLLSNLRKMDLLLPNGVGVGSLTVRDRQGFSLHQSSSAWIQKAPDVTYGREAGVVEWPIRCANMEHTVGGNLAAIGGAIIAP